MKALYSIVATKHCGEGAPAALAALKQGDALSLVREPTNAVDPNAIQVWANGMHIGYLPGKKNADLARKMDQTGSMAADRAPKRDAVLVRSPNSGFPMAEVEE
jgi:HIRAN domain